jgi:hypothetical protein
VSTGAAAPSTDTWAGALLAACAAAAGAELEYAEAPEALDVAQGAWAFGFRLARLASEPAPVELGEDRWTVPLLARLATDRLQLEREAAAIDLSRRGVGGPRSTRIVKLAGAGWPEPLHALIGEAPGGVGLPELIGRNLHQSEALMHGFAEEHAAIHRLPIGDCPRVPAITAAVEVERIDSGRFPAERRWLEEHLPDSGAPALCHGGYQPGCVYGPPRTAWAEHGGPGRDLIVSNWCGAVLAEREFDVAFTYVAFWSSPFFAKTRSDRTAMKMIRNSLLTAYTRGYPGYDELDPERVRFWRVFHVVRGMARLDRSYRAEGSPFEPQDRGSLPAELRPELERYARQLTRQR